MEVVENHRPEYYGISWMLGSSELILSHSGVNNADLVDLASYATSEVGWLSRGEWRTEPFLSAALTSFSRAPDGRVLVTNTGRATGSSDRTSGRARPLS